MKTLVPTKLCALMLVSVGCSDSSGEVGIPLASITGTLTLPGTATAPYFVRLQRMVGAAPVAETLGTTNGTWTLLYSMTNVPAGTFFMVAAVDVDNSGGTSSTAGDYRGWYGHNGDGNPPVAANVTVPATGTVTIDYRLVLTP